VAISPLPCGPVAPTHPFGASLRGRWARWRGADILPSDVEARRLLGLGRDQLRPEASHWLDEIAAIDLGSRRDGLPRLILAGEADPCAPPEAIEALARRAGAECMAEAAAGHDLPYGPGWQATAAELHRWLVQRLGESLLLLRGDEDLRDE
jgi:pimeloyl-ACP methyl ester carboxylesterase